MADKDKSLFESGGPSIAGSSSGQKQQQALDAAISKFKGQSTPTNGGSKDPLVYLGQSQALQGEMRFTAGSSMYDKTGKASEVAGQYYQWSDKTKNKFLTQLNLAGYDTSQMRDAQIAQLWSGYVGQASSYYQSGKKLTPWDILAKDMQQREQYMNTPRSVTQTSTAYDMSTQADAHAIFLQAAQQLLGRDPTKSEISSFKGALNKYEKANPTTTTQTTNYLGDTVTGQTSTTKGGVKDSARSLMAVEDVKADPEYGAYQAATTYFDAMMEMVGGG